jgi:branched-chain amino acid transport system ATP-binding protein
MPPHKTPSYGLGGNHGHFENASKAEGISVLLVEQNARMSLEIADDAYVLDDGMVVYSGTARELAADEARVRALASAEEWTLT